MQSPQPPSTHEREPEQDFQILATTLSSHPSTLSYHRIRTLPSSQIKYLSFPPAVDLSSYPNPHRSNLAFPTLPSGTWKVAHLEPTNPSLPASSSNPLELVSTSPRTLPGISPTWHGTFVDESSIPWEKAVRCSDGKGRVGGEKEQDYSHVLIFSTLYRDWWPGHPEVKVVKHWSPTVLDMLGMDTRVYGLLRGRGLDAEVAAEEFLGHVTVGVEEEDRPEGEGEDGKGRENCRRVIGYVLSSSSPGRRPRPGDVEGCVKALEGLHGLGFALGWVGVEAFVFKEGEGVGLDGFPAVYETSDPGIFEREVKEVRNLFRGV